MPANPFLVSFAAALVRGYMRFVPLRIGKHALWRKVFARYIGWRSMPARVVRTRFGSRMRVQPPDLVRSVIWLTGQWEPWITRYVIANLRPGDVFVDVGANVGYYTLLAATITGDAGRVYALEASPEIFAELKRNLMLNPELHNVDAICKAASSGPGRLRMWMGDSTNRGASTTVDAVAASSGLELEAEVECDALNHLIPTKDLLRARLIKIDVEGAERRVLEPLRGLLQDFSADTEWLVELNPVIAETGVADVEQIYAMFIASGYAAYSIPNAYSVDAYLDRPRHARRARLRMAPTAGLCDVVFSRR